MKVEEGYEETTDDDERTINRRIGGNYKKFKKQLGIQE